MPTIVTRIVYNRLPAITAALQPAVRDIVMRNAARVEAHIKESMAQPKTGRVYPNGHVASAPGESPAIDTGALANSIQVKQIGPTSAAVSTNQEYAARLEYGGYGSAARPAWVPAAEDVRPRFIADMENLEAMLG